MRTLPALGVGLLTAALVLTGCSTDDDDSEPDRPALPANWREAGSPGGMQYVALGDSYVAAPGVPETDLNNPCMPSSNNYPALVAQALKVDHLVDASCGGATSDHMTESQAPGQPPQFDALGEETDLVTITIGGNDNDVFGKLIIDCVAAADLDPTGAPCRGKESAPDQALLPRVDDTATKVETMLAELTELAPNALVVVIGYPQIVPASGGCPEQFPLAEGDFAYAREINEQLNVLLEEAARNHDLEYVDMWALSEGHDVCSDDPWVNGAGNRPDAAPYHPFAAQQQAAADAIVEIVRARG